MIDTNQCPKCKIYILGTYCYGCDLDIRDVINPFPTGNPLDDLFGDAFKKEDK